MLPSASIPLPEISHATRAKLHRDFTTDNKLYSQFNRPRWMIPHIWEYSFVTNGVSIAAILCGIIARKHYFSDAGYYVIAIMSQILGMWQTRGYDRYYWEFTVSNNPKVQLLRYPILKQSFDEVSRYVDSYIEELKRRVAELYHEQYLKSP